MSYYIQMQVPFCRAQILTQDHRFTLIRLTRAHIRSPRVGIIADTGQDPRSSHSCL